ncbi:hypothetical protein Fot_23851 [Forsythia ovata]|uniref:Uncharacterized protein n=1 Tax=Forsythia ovata TaxID=205694 RepID=A0ABD1U4K5_9LAMI
MGLGYLAPLNLGLGSIQPLSQTGTRPILPLPTWDSAICASPKLGHDYLAPPNMGLDYLAPLNLGLSFIQPPTQLRPRPFSLSPNLRLGYSLFILHPHQNKNHQEFQGSPPT